MPVIQLQYPQSALDTERKAQLAGRLTEVLLTMEGGARTAGGVGFASVLFTEVPQGDWWTGGRPDDTFVHAPGKFLAHVSIPEGYMSQAHKTEVHVAVHAAIVDCAGGSREPQHGASVLVIIDEVVEGNWGVGGKTISLATIAEAVGLPKQGERFQWVRAYFAAKARQFKTAGYPAGTGGLFPTEGQATTDRRFS
jgi:phenylpyruvate tautomerase PptA (4-oxalocrotonate tautomerase family)